MSKRAAILLSALLVSTAVLADAQSDRAAFINMLIGKGIFSSVAVVDDTPTLAVSTTFHDSDIDSKQSVCQTVYAYYQALNSSYASVLVVDAGSGAQIGVITAQGLQLF